VTSLYERAAILPGRSMTRSKKIFGRWATHGHGAVLHDTEGREYIDMLCALGAISLGYRAPVVWDVGGVTSLPWEEEVTAAEAVLQHVAPWASWVRFVKTGSESTHAAYRIAKAVTGRSAVWIGDWAFHGWHEWCAESEDIFRHGQDPATFNHRYPDTIAAVFIEPHRWEPVDVEWLRSVRAFCDRIGALLVFDSMIYGGRWHLQGTSGYFGVKADLECFGKAFGNGQAVAFVVGTERTKAHGEIPSGTYSGCTVGLSAVIDTLQEYTTQPVIDTMWARGRQLAAGLDALVSAYPSLLKSRDGAPVHQRLTFQNPEHGGRFSAEMLSRGVIWHPGCTNVMAAHTPGQIDTVLIAARESLGALL